MTTAEILAKRKSLSEAAKTLMGDMPALPQFEPRAHSAGSGSFQLTERGTWCCHGFALFPEGIPHLLRFLKSHHPDEFARVAAEAPQQ